MKTSPERRSNISPKEKELKGIQLVISDWSGVISDDRLPVYEANMRVIESYGKQRVSFDEWLPSTRMRPDELFADHGIIDTIDNFYEKYRTFFNQVRTEGIHPVLYPDVIEALDTLSEKGLPIFVVSSHPKENLREEAKEYDIERFIEDFFGSVTDKTEAMLEVCKKTGIVPEQAIYMGDTIYDVHAAKKAGVKSVALTAGYHSKERLTAEGPALVLDSLSALIPHLI